LPFQERGRKVVESPEGVLLFFDGLLLKRRS
jgi:hypothetical protein